MDILFQSHKLEKLCNNQSQLIKKHGPICAKLIRRRLDDLSAVECLEDMRYLPQAKCHELVGDRKGTLAVSLEYPYRLIFEPANVPMPKKLDGGLDWAVVTVIRVLAVEDYHD